MTQHTVARARSSASRLKICARLVIGFAFATSLVACAQSMRAPPPSNAVEPKRGTTELAGPSDAAESPERSASVANSSTSTQTSPASEPATTIRPIADRPQEVSDCSRPDDRAWLRTKADYRPPSMAAYSSIIQGQEYAPIQAIRTLYVEASSTTEFGDFGFEDQREFSADLSKIVIRGPRSATAIELGNGIRVGHRLYADTETTLLFRTLGRLLVDLGSTCKPRGIRGRHLATRAYRDDIKVEFNFGPAVVSLSSASNGPDNPERLYVLDLVDVEQSALWAEHQLLRAPD